MRASTVARTFPLVADERTGLGRTAQSLLALATDTGRSNLEARQLAESALVCARAAQDPRLEAHAERTVAWLCYLGGDASRAREAFVRAADLYGASGDRAHARLLRASTAFLAYDRGDPATATSLLDQLESDLAAAGDRDLAAGEISARIACYRGNIARQAGAIPDARAHYREALARTDVPAAAPLRRVVEMDAGIAELVAGRPIAALAWLERASIESGDDSRASARQLVRRLVGHYRALASWMARRPIDTTPIDDGPFALEPIRAWLHDATGGGTRRPATTAALARRLARMEARATFEHERISVRILGALAPLDPGRGAIVVARDGRTIVRGSVVAHLDRREPLRRMLEALARSEAPVPLERLIAIAWPGERIRDRAAKNRAHVALSTLRSLGLGGALRCTDGGYVLDRRDVDVA